MTATCPTALRRCFEKGAASGDRRGAVGPYTLQCACLRTCTASEVEAAARGHKAELHVIVERYLAYLRKHDPTEFAALDAFWSRSFSPWSL
jgi:hypothetical protein